MTKVLNGREMAAAVRALCRSDAPALRLMKDVGGFNENRPLGFVGNRRTYTTTVRLHPKGPMEENENIPAKTTALPPGWLSVSSFIP